MADIRGMVRDWLRNYNVDGVPSSGIYEPPKNEGIALFDEVDVQLKDIRSAFAAGSMKGYSSVSAMNADFANQPLNSFAIILSSDADSLKIYQRGASVWEYRTTLSVADLDDISERVDRLDSIVTQTDAITPFFSITDPNDFIGFVITEQGGIATESIQINTDIAAEEILVVDQKGFILWRSSPISGQWVPGARIVADDRDPNAVFTVCDAYDFIVFQVRIDGSIIAGNIGSGGNSAGGSAIAERNARALAYSQAIHNTFLDNLCRPYWNINFVASYGQSLEIGAEAFPTLTTKQYGNLMLGNSVRPTSANATTYSVNGTEQFNPLVSTAQHQTNGTLYSYSQQVNNFPNNDANSPRGVTPVEGAVSFLKHLWMVSEGLLSDSDRVFLPTANGRGSSGLPLLSKGSSPEYYAKVPDGAQKVKNLADAASKTVGCAALVWIQGENNYSSSTPKDTYKTLLKQLRVDLTQDICRTIMNQQFDPGFYTYQTSGSYTKDTLNLAIGNAQLELAKEEPNWFLCAPAYPVTNKVSGHLNSNGSRWLGMQIGKVMHWTMILGRGWLPVHPIRATFSGQEVLIDFHVPVPPLVFARPYVDDTATDFLNKGFAVFDDSGQIALSSVDIVADAVVRLSLGRVPGANPHIRYAGLAVFGGNGCLRDSDPTTASELYENIPAEGVYSEVNPPELIGKPYPLQNWSAAYDIPLLAN